MRNFTEGSVPRHLISFSLPIIMADLLASIYMVVDAVWVGRLLGHESLAAISASFPIAFFVFAILIGLSISTNILVGQSYGAQNPNLLSQVLTNSFIATVGLSLVVSLAGIAVSRPMLVIINTPQEIRRDAYIYLVIILAGMIVRALYNWFSSVLKGLGDSKTPFKLLALSVLLNIIITPILILGLGPFPPMGVAGSALGTVGSSVIATFIGYIYLIRKNHILDIAKWRFGLSSGIMRKIFTVGAPVSIQMVIRSLSWAAIISLVNKFGPEVTAAYGIGIRIDMFAFLPALSVGLAVSSMVAQNLGASQKEKVPEILKWAIAFSLCFSFLFFVIVNLYPRLLASVFTSDTSVIIYTEGYLRIVSVAYLVFSFIFSMQGVIRGAGDTKYLVLFIFISMLVFRVPMAYILAQKTALKELGIWIAILTSAFVAMALNWIYYTSGKWKRKPIIESLAYS